VVEKESEALRWVARQWQRLLVICPRMTCKVGQMSTRPCGVSISKTLRFRHCCADVDETWRLYSMGRETSF